ncbi:ArsR/SmtB family transcription factor [Desulfomonile tiedjei]|uniref:Putative transcriptional regulator n=1 Tax=Desulfomonile tiedjei (strain ATCC 49306 / DSM 6799 / DCB-1) TaxID=706587 RepID=I4CEI6_DESTA|nr:metalloregulator ArsR/SmtB family transcription factor [Desulfomonile tiedjei]AFM27977.1 putative transcriptional regulator [Desulfomonile tiedjei DSM 6799]
MREFMDIVKALADENRVRALLSLREGELCVCQIIELLNLAPSTVSKHMSVLKQARLVEATKRGRWIYYRLPNEAEASRLVANAVSFVFGSVSESPSVLQDVERLRTVLQELPHELCTQQGRRRNLRNGGR